MRKSFRGSGCLLLILSMAAVFIMAMAIFWFIDTMQAKVLLGDQDWIFFEPKTYAMKIYIFVVVVILMEGAMALSYKASGNSFMEGAYTFMKVLWRFKVPAIILSVILLSVGFTGINAVYEDSVTSYSILRPSGRAYDLELISSVDTGFRKNGDFYYEINVDGKTLKFSTPTVNSRLFPEYETETYKEFYDLDARLTALGIPKNADADSLKYAEYDESCMKYLRPVVSE